MDNKKETIIDDIEKEFNRAVAFTQKEISTIAQKDQLKLYGYYKIAAVGKCKGSRPGMLKVKDRAKYDAWKSCNDLSKEEATKKYIELAKSLIPSLRMHVTL